MDWFVIVMTLPFIGAAAGVVLRSRPWAVKGAALFVSGLTLLGVVSDAAQAPDPAAATLMTLIAVTAVAAILGQSPTRHAPLAIVMILLMLGLSLFALTAGQPTRHLLAGGILGAMALLVVGKTGEPADALSRGVAVGCSVGILALAASAVSSGSVAAVWRLIAVATLLPLFPFQTAFVGSLSVLPGTLPAFLAVALPCLGWRELLSVMPEVPASIVQALGPLALGGALYAAVRASAQGHLARMLASITTLLVALVWWHVGVTGGAASEAGWYLGAVTLAAGGLLLAGHQVEARYGSQALDTLRGLAHPMPRFAVLVGLLVMAAAGLPLFGVFPAFMAMMVLSSGVALPGAALVLLLWLVASLMLVKLLQRLLCGPARTDVVHHDLTPVEIVPLVLLLGLLALGGGAWMNPFQPAVQAGATAVAEGAP